MRDTDGEEDRMTEVARRKSQAREGLTPGMWNQSTVASLGM